MPSGAFCKRSRGRHTPEIPKRRRASPVFSLASPAHNGFVKGIHCTRHSTAAMPNVLPLVLAVLLPALAAQDSVQSFLDALNQSLRGDATGLASLFAADSECHVGERTIATGPNAIAEALLPPAFSEQTRPRLENPDVFPLTSELAAVTAQQVSYGTLILKQNRPVVLLLRHTAEGWRILSWSMPAPPPFPFPARAAPR